MNAKGMNEIKRTIKQQMKKNNRTEKEEKEEKEKPKETKMKGRKTKEN